jgi:hypothetical protein
LLLDDRADPHTPAATPPQSKKTKPDENARAHYVGIGLMIQRCESAKRFSAVGS